MKFKNPFENKTEVKENYENKTDQKNKLIPFILFAIVMTFIFFPSAVAITYFLLKRGDNASEIDKHTYDSTLLNNKTFFDKYVSRAITILFTLFTFGYSIIFLFLLIINGTKNVSAWTYRSLFTHFLYFLLPLFATIVLLYFYNFGENTIGYAYLLMTSRINQITSFLKPQGFDDFPNKEIPYVWFNNVLDYFVTRFNITNFVDEIDKFVGQTNSTDYPDIKFSSTSEGTPTREGIKQLLKMTMAHAVLDKYYMGHAVITGLVAVLCGMYVISKHERPSKGVTG
jgi:hypothetical protein